MERGEAEVPGEPRRRHERRVSGGEDGRRSRERKEREEAKHADRFGFPMREVAPDTVVVVLDIQNAGIPVAGLASARGAEVGARIEGRPLPAANAAQARHGSIRHPVNLLP
jgi:hypothetical protein